MVRTLNYLHDENDAAVLDAYGWPRELDDEGIVERVVALRRP